MSRIILNDCNVSGVKGYCAYTSNADNNPYNVDECTDDEYNILSGMYYVSQETLNRYCIDAISYPRGYVDGEVLVEDEDGHTVVISGKVLKAIVKDISDYVVGDIREYITSFIETHLADEEHPMDDDDEMEN